MSVIRTAAKRMVILFGHHRKMLRRRMAERGNRLTVVLHRVLPVEAGTDFSPGGMVVTVPSFGRLLDFLGGEYDILGPGKFLEGYPAPLPRPSVLVTFDDGWRDSVTNGTAELARRGVGGALFVSVDHVEHGRLFWPERLLASLASGGGEAFRRVTGREPPRAGDREGVEALLTKWKTMADAARDDILERIATERGSAPGGRRVATWDEIAAAAGGGVEIGSHGMTHRLLGRILAEDAATELRRSREALAARLGSAPRLVAYPNGDRTPPVREAARTAGYDFGFSLRGDPRDPYDLPRVNLHEGKMTERGVWSADRLVWALAAG